jgi:hypothetical protein
MTDVTVLTTKRVEYSLGFTHLMLFPVEIIVSLYAEANVMKNFFYHSELPWVVWFYKIYVV